MGILKKIYYFFPVQLLLLNLRKYPAFLLTWLLCFGIATGVIGIEYGAPNLFFDPEYLGKTGYLSFALVGIGFGSFFVAWNLNCYILHNHRFPFLTRYKKPMGLFFLNNAIIPIIFIVGYFRNVIIYQRQYEYSTYKHIAIDLLGFTAGASLIILLTAFYYSFTNREKLYSKEDKSKRWRFWIMKREFFSYDQDERVKVTSFLSRGIHIVNIDPLLPTEYEDARLVFRQHHLNALLAQGVIFIIIISIGFYIENPIFQLPVIGSALLFLSLLISIFGSLTYWTGRWATVMIICILIFTNYLSQFDFLGYKSAAYGLTYNIDNLRKYSMQEFRDLASDSNIREDSRYFTAILNNWKKKQPRATKPKLLFINASGGGSRASMFSTVILQHADSLLQNTLFDRIFMMSGASGGMFGLATIRELFLEKKLGAYIDLTDKKYARQLAGDLLNPMFISMLSNDILLPIHKFKFDSITYFRDRGYMMEQQFIKNVEGRLNKRVSDYKSFEYSGLIPLLTMHTTVINDSRRFFISPHPVSFLMRQRKEYQSNTLPEIDAIDFGAFFKNQRGNNLRFTSALRMNATFPFILPNTQLPTDPPTFVMDGGAADNFGTETSLRFIQTFRDWINQNTSGVIIIQIRDTKKEDDLSTYYEKKTVLSQMLDPIGQFISNLENYQDFRVDQQLNSINLNVKLQMVTFEYVPEKKEEKAALSLHLTEREKRDIFSAVHSTNNTKAFILLDKWLKE